MLTIICAATRFSQAIPFCNNPSLSSSLLTLGNSVDPRYQLSTLNIKHVVSSTYRPRGLRSDSIRLSSPCSVIIVWKTELIRITEFSL